MSVAAIAVGVVAAGSAAYSAHQANKKAKAVGGSLDDTIAYARANPEVFGEKIPFKSVGYSPLFSSDAGYGNLAGNVIAGNQRNLGANLALTSQTNNAISADAVNRINTLYPGFMDAFQQQGNNTAAQLRGEIPASDRDAITSRRAEAISLGGGGNVAQQTAADLGLSRMQVMGQGAANLNNNVQLWGQIDPLARHLMPQSNFVDVGNAVNSSIAENQFASTFAAGERDAKFNAAMLPDPQMAGLMNLEAQRAGLQAANPQQSVVGNALVAGATAGVGAYNTQQSDARWRETLASMQQQPAAYQNRDYLGPAQQSYASTAMQQAGIPNMSNTGPVSTPYNPYTGGSYGDQGGLWATVGKPKTKNAYSFQ